MPLNLICCLENLLRRCRAGIRMVASRWAMPAAAMQMVAVQAVGSIAIAVIAITGPPCAGQDFLQQLGGEQTAEPATLTTLLAEPDLLNELRLNQGQRDEIAKILAAQQSQRQQLQASHDEQLKGVTSIRDRLRKRAASRGEMRSAMAKQQQIAEQALRALLNTQQISAIDEKLAASASSTLSASIAAGSAAKGSTTTGSVTSESNATLKSDPAAESAPAGANRGQQRAEPTGRPPSAEASFAINDPVGTATHPTAGNLPAGGTSPARVAFNFHKAPWPDVLRLFSDAAKLNLNLRDTPPGTFTYYDSQQYTPLEALDIMNRFLLQDGFLLLPHDRFLTVLDAKKGIPPNLVETVSPAELAVRGDTEFLRVAFALGDREAAAAAEEVRGLLGPQGTVVPLESANSIVVADIASNLARVKQLLEPPPKVEATDRMFRSFPLVHIDAPSAAEIVSSLFGLQAGLQNVSEAGGNSSRSSRSSRGSSDDFRAAIRERIFGGGGRGGGDSSSSRGGSSRGRSPSNASTEEAADAAKVTVDLRTNTLLVTATAEEMKLVEEIVESLDVPPSQQGALGGLASNEPYLQVYELNTASASEVAKTLTVLHPGMVINEDGSAKRIHIWADAASHREIATHVRQLDGAIAGEVIAIIGLNGQNAYDISAKLTSLYKADAAGAPAIELDPSGQGLMIRGNASQIAQIRSLVDQLGAAGPYESQQAVRLVPVSSNNSAYLQQAIGALYPQVTVIESEQPESSSSSGGSSSSRSRDRSRNSSSEDAERAERIRRFMEMRARFGGFGRGSSDSGRDSGRGGGDRGRSDRGGGDRGRGGGDRSSRGGR